MTILERNREIERRITHLDPLREPLTEIFTTGKREQLLSGVDADGTPFAPLMPSTLQNRSGGGPPLAPDYEQSRIVTGYVVQLELDQGVIIVQAGWPTLPWVKYHQSGTARMRQRDPGGFRAQDKEKAIATLREYCFRG